MKIAKLVSAIRPEKVTSPAQLNTILRSTHNPEKFLGMLISYKFKVSQDVFEAATKGLTELRIPDNSHIKLNGTGASNLKLFVGKDATFKAPNGIFNFVHSKGKNTIVDMVIGDLYTFGNGKSKTKIVFGDAVSGENSRQKNKAVIKNAYAFGESIQENGNVFGKAETGGTAQQNNKSVKGNVKSIDKSIQRTIEVHGNATSDGYSRQVNEIVDGNVTSEGHSEQINGLVKKEALSMHHSSQTNHNVLGKAQSAWYSEQRNFKTNSETVMGKDSIQVND